MRVGEPLWYRPVGKEAGPLAAIVTRVNGTVDGADVVNVQVLDDGTGVLTDGLAAVPKRNVTVRYSYDKASPGECSWRSWGGE